MSADTIGVHVRLCPASVGISSSLGAQSQSTPRPPRSPLRFPASTCRPTVCQLCTKCSEQSENNAYYNINLNEFDRVENCTIRKVHELNRQFQLSKSYTRCIKKFRNCYLLSIPLNFMFSHEKYINNYGALSRIIFRTRLTII